MLIVFNKSSQFPAQLTMQIKDREHKFKNKNKNFTAISEEFFITTL